MTNKLHNQKFITQIMNECWGKIAPLWPLKNLIAVNPLQGFENLPIETAITQGAGFFQQKNIPAPMEKINTETIKWLQAFFDEGQATIPMPLCSQGFYTSLLRLIYYDKQIHSDDIGKKSWLLELPQSSEETVAACLVKLKIPEQEQELFLTLMLTTLPGWSSYIKYKIDWADKEKNQVTYTDYLAIRLVITYLIWDQARDLVMWHNKIDTSVIKTDNPIENIKKSEIKYYSALLNKLNVKYTNKPFIPDAQFVFCIDVRSEPFRRSLEAQGNYETFGFAGFFGIPVRIKNGVTEESYASCPVLIKTQQTVTEIPFCSQKTTALDKRGYENIKTLKKLYQSLKYNFTTPLILVDILGLASGILMFLKTFFPILTEQIKFSASQLIRPNVPVIPSLQSIPFIEQCSYAEEALKMIGITKDYAPLVIFCGHGSTTKNNPYATALDCGACGGHHGASNARILAAILNDEKIRLYLSKKNILIHNSTRFIAAEHNTTTDAVELFLFESYDAQITKKIESLKKDLVSAQERNIQWRSKKMNFSGNKNEYEINPKIRSNDWSQVRPEWGLAGNASFIVAPRDLTKHIDLDGRSFLHSYDYQYDTDGAFLTSILTAPMIVAQWINTQYLFSSIDNVAYGAGSKITQNITGKFGVMQGNSSDLMIGLPLQSLYIDDETIYRDPVRLTTIIYAQKSLIDIVIQKQQILQKLLGNGWINFISIDPEDHRHYFLQRDLTWKKINNDNL